MFAVIPLLVILIIAVPGCPVSSSKTPVATSIPATPLEQRVSAIESWKGNVDSRLSTLGNQEDTIDDLSSDLEEAVATEKDDIARLQDDITALEDRLVAIEEGGGSSGDGDGLEYETTRWVPALELEKTNGGKVSITNISWYPTRIKDEDTYRITFDIENTGVELTKEVLYIVFTPSSRDTNVDIANTGMYSTKPVNMWWDVEYSPSTGEECKRIEFISDQFTVPDSSLSPLEVTVEFDLYYQ